MSSMLGPALRMLVSLAVVLALMYVAARLLARTRGAMPMRPTARRAPGKAAAMVAPLKSRGSGRRSERTRPGLELLARQPLGKAASVAIVRVAGRSLLLGVTDSAVQLLTEIGADSLEPEPVAEPAEAAIRVAPSAVPAAVSVLDLLRERTVRRA